MTPAEIAARCANDPAFFAEVTLKIAEAMQGQKKVVRAALTSLTGDDLWIIRQHGIALDDGSWSILWFGRSEL